MLQVLRINFVVSVWVSVALAALLLIVSWPHGDPGALAPQKGTVQFALLVVLFQPFLWHFYYRVDENPAAAASMSAFFAFPIVAAAIADSANGTHKLWSPIFFVLAYVSISHLAYAFWQWKSGLRSWLDR